MPSQSGDYYVNIIAQTKEAITGIKNLALGVGAAIAAFKTLERGIKIAIDAAKLSAEFNQINKAFGNMATRAGSDADKVLASLKKMSSGTINSLDLVRSASKAALFGLPLQDLDKLMAIARASATATGQSIGKMFDDIVTGIARGSPMILDNLGLTLKIGEATDAYAKSIGKTSEELTAEERKMATLNATLEAGTKIMDNLGDAATEVTDLQKWDQMTAAVTDLKIELGLVLTDIMRPLIEATTTLFTRIVSGLKHIREYTAAVETPAAKRTFAQDLLIQSTLMPWQTITGEGTGKDLKFQLPGEEPLTIPEALGADELPATINKINDMTDAVRSLREEVGALMMGAGPGLMKAPKVDLGIWTGLPGQSLASRLPSRFAAKEESAYSQFYGGGQGEKFADYARESMKGMADVIGGADKAMTPLVDKTMMMGNMWAQMAGTAVGFVKTLFEGGEAGEAMMQMIQKVVVSIAAAMAAVATAEAMINPLRAKDAVAWTILGASVAAMAQGGIVTRPTMALIGERGPEAVVPLNRAGGMGTTININAGSVIAERSLRNMVLGMSRGR
uniref:Putative tail protein n=1 Tax=viral metagenome TaxID=1070528 RepID=A0A6M3L5L2_9ZZZZ